MTKIIIGVQFLFIILLSSLLARDILWDKINEGVIQTKIDELNIGSSQQPTRNLELLYFDDFVDVWGNGRPDGKTEWKAGDSKYAARTTPLPVIHPLTLNSTQEKLVAIPRNEVLAKIDPSGENNTMPLIEETAKKYGEVRATHFVSTGQHILTQRYFDVDSDGIKEEIIETMGIGGNHPPHEGFILKNDTIILSLPLNSGGIEPSSDGNGFYVKHQIYDDQPMCCPLKYRLYRVIYEDEKFAPVWEQEVTYIRVNGSDASEAISENNAITIVSNYPEVKNFIERMKKNNQKIIIEANNKSESSNWNVQVAEVYPDRTATFNWYTLDKQTGKLLCSFFIYDAKGKDFRSNDKYPCD